MLGKRLICAFILTFLFLPRWKDPYSASKLSKFTLLPYPLTTLLSVLPICMLTPTCTPNPNPHKWS